MGEGVSTLASERLDFLFGISSTVVARNTDLAVDNLGISTRSRKTQTSEQVKCIGVTFVIIPITSISGRLGSASESFGKKSHVVVCHVGEKVSHVEADRSGTSNDVFTRSGGINGRRVFGHDS